MLLRSISKHVKDQNWFAVVLDFFIVLAGILIAFQITNWNEGRQERIQETHILNSLSLDFQELEITMQHGINFHSRTLVGLQTVVEVVDKGEMDPKERIEFENGLRYGYAYAATNKSSGILDEIIANGQLSLIRDAELRKILSEYQSFQQGVTLSIRGLAGNRNPFLKVFTSQFRYDLTRDHFRSDQEHKRAFKFSAIGDYDLAAMASDPEFIEAVEELYQFQRIWKQYEEKTMVRIQNIRTQLGDNIPAVEAK